MSAHDQIRSMLDELMGTDRDGERPKCHFSDRSVCKSFLLGCCPHDILQGTRMDIGECPKIHELALKADYQKQPDNRKYYFELDALDHLESFIKDCDRRTEQAKRRLKETQEDLPDDASETAEKISKLGEDIGTKLASAERLGAEGRVEESLALMKEVEELNRVKNEAEKDFREAMPVNSYQQQKLRVCEVCSAYLGIHDNDRRLADHFGGKLHLGFIQIRERLQELQETCRELKEERHRERMSRYPDHRRSEERSRHSDDRRRRSRSRSRHRHRHRSPDSRRSKRSHRSRSRDRHSRRSHSKRSKRSRSRSTRRSGSARSSEHRRTNSREENGLDSRGDRESPRSAEKNSSGAPPLETQNST